MMARQRLLVARQVAAIVRLSVVAWMAWTLLSTPVHSANFSWNAGSGLFNDSANYLQGGFPIDADGVPDADDVVTFNRGSVPAYSVGFSTLTPFPQVIQATIDRLLVRTNTLAFSGSTLLGNSSSLTVDNTSPSETARGVVIGTTTGDAAVLTTSLPGGLNALYATLGSATGSNGTLNVSGSNSTFNVIGAAAVFELIVGLDGTGTLNVSGGADILVAGDTALGRNAMGIGNATVSGSGSTWNSAGSLRVGVDGVGTLNVVNDGVLMSGETSIGQQPGVLSRAFIDGSNSRWTINGSFFIGDHGIGLLEISNGGRVEKLGGALSDSVIGYGGVGDVFVRSNSFWTNSRTLYLGENGGIGTLAVDTGGNVTSIGGSLGGTAGSTGIATIDGDNSSWNLSGPLNVGTFGSGALTIQNGARVAGTTGGVGLGPGPMAAATVSGIDPISGNHALWTNSGSLTVGGTGIDAENLATGMLTIEAGGFVDNSLGIVGAGLYSDAIVAVRGTGGGIPTSWTNRDQITLGQNGKGTLVVEDGGHVSSAGAVLGDLADSIGEATLAGAGSVWTTSERVVVGNFGMGRLTLADNSLLNITSTTGFGIDVGVFGVGVIDVEAASVDVQAAIYVGGSFEAGNGDGTLRIMSGGDVSSAASGIAFNANTTGRVLVSGDQSTWDLSGAIHVGYRGTGALTIENGAAVTASENAVIGSELSGVGVATVSGQDATWTMDELRVGRNGTGTLTIQDGGQVLLHGTAYVGFSMDAEGTVTVADDDSAWSIGEDLRVGESGKATLRIEAGGAVANQNGSIGHQSGAEGAVSITNASWMNSLDLAVGNANQSVGTLDVLTGGSVSNVSGNVGNNAGSEGMVTVSGEGAIWTNSGTLRIGNFGDGTLVVGSGGSVSNPNAAIAAGTGSVGTAMIGGTGATWTTAGRLSIGGDASTNTVGGAGTLHVHAGATVRVTQDIVLFSAGAVDFDGGTLAAALVNLQSGGAFDWTGGTLHVGTLNGNLVNQGGKLAPGMSAGSTTIIGNYTHQSGATLEIEIGGPLVNTQHDFVNVTGTALLSGDLEVALIGGYAPESNLSFTVLSAGTLLSFFSNVTSGQRLTTSDGRGSFLVYYGPTSPFNPNQIMLTDFESFGIPGDYNGDGRVDAGDYVRWRNHLGDLDESAINNNGDGSGVSLSDYTWWKLHYGTPGSGQGGLLPSVPEPTSAMLQGFASLLAIAYASHARLTRRRTSAGRLPSHPAGVRAPLSWIPGWRSAPAA